MKRFIFSAIALIVTATACTESGIIDKPEFYGNPIVFDTYIGKHPVTKAENINIDYVEQSLENGGGAQIYAFKCPTGDATLSNADYTAAYLNGRLVSTSGAWTYYVDNGTNWVLDEAYWPDRKGLGFVAYNLAAEQNIVDETKTTTQFDFEVMDAVMDQVDLLVTPFTYGTDNGAPVSLTFKHLLSRVGFKVLPTSATGADIHIHQITLRGSFPKFGRVDMTAAKPVTSGSNTTQTTPIIVPNTAGAYASEYNLFNANRSFSITCAECLDDNNNLVAKPIFANTFNEPTQDADKVLAEKSRYMMIMPGAQTNAIVEVNYSLGSSSEPLYAKVPLTATENFKPFEAGKAYEFVLTIASAAMEFSAEIVEGDWNTPTSEDI